MVEWVTRAVSGAMAGPDMVGESRGRCRVEGEEAA
jgi:hypothetical protein